MNAESGRPGSGYCPAAMQAVAYADHRGAVHSTGRTSGVRMVHPSRLS